ncbi:MAG: response regulator transcription factor [Candidatus Nanopelagicales bacterium]
MTHILLAEDSPRIASFVTKGLRANGFAVTHTPDGVEALHLATQEDFDLLILDIGLPGKDGFEVLHDLRGSGSALPVLILTARDSVADTVAGLDGGADDYMAKPFSFDELLARVRRRIRPSMEAGTQSLSAGDVHLDLMTRRVTVAGHEHELTAREFSMLEMFLRHQGQVLSREQLLSGVWGFDYDPGSNVVDVYVRYLRKKLGDGAITTVRGMGYRLEQG